MSMAVIVWGVFFILGCTHIQGNIRTMGGDGQQAFRQAKYWRSLNQPKLQQRDDPQYVTIEQFNVLVSEVNGLSQQVTKLESRMDQDNCEDSPCKNQGTCRSRFDGYDCLCKPGYEGANCEHAGGMEVSARLNVSNTNDWGVWAVESLCPVGSFASKFSIKLEDDQGKGDDTAMNNIKLGCTDILTKKDSATIISGYGPYGTWRDWQECPEGEFFTDFKLKVESDQGNDKDDTSVNGITMTCSGGNTHTGTTGSWGEYGSPASCPDGHFICGVATKIETKFGGTKDVTGLNDISMLCCVWW